MLAANKGKRPALAEQPLWPELEGDWGTHDTANGGGRFYTLRYTRREGGGGISLQAWYSIGDDDPSKRIALHDKAFQVGEGRVDVGKSQESATKSFEKQVTPGDYTVSKKVFNDCQERWGKFEIDVFASEATAHCRRFFIAGNADDPYADLGSAEGANALRMIWVREERIWAHPPCELLPKLLDVLEAPNCTAETVVVCPDEHEVVGTVKRLNHTAPDWYNRLLALSDDRLQYPPGELRKVAEDAPADVHLWPLCVFHVPPKHRFLHRRNARVSVDCTALKHRYECQQQPQSQPASLSPHPHSPRRNATPSHAAIAPPAPVARPIVNPHVELYRAKAAQAAVAEADEDQEHRRARVEAAFDLATISKLLDAADWTGMHARLTRGGQVQDGHSRHEAHFR